MQVLPTHSPPLSPSACGDRAQSWGACCATWHSTDGVLDGESAVRAVQHVGQRSGFELRQRRGTGHTHIITKVQIRRIGFGFERKGCRGLSSWEAWLGEEIDDIGAICRVYWLGPGTGIETERETPVAIGVKVLLVAWYLLGIVESRCADRV